MPPKYAMNAENYLPFSVFAKNLLHAYESLPLRKMLSVEMLISKKFALLQYSMDVVMPHTCIRMGKLHLKTAISIGMYLAFYFP